MSILPLPPPERVLPTLNNDGTRRHIQPKTYRGRFYRQRLITGWALIAIFVLIPFIKLRGKPLVLLDIPARAFTLFGRTFLATDGVLLMLFLLSVFVFIIWLTALVGRAWCGWACPQTVYMEFLFRPIERLIEGDRAERIRLDQAPGLKPRRILKLALFGLASVFVANVFLAYFVGVARLGRWVTQSPFEHPAPFMVMAVTAGLVLFDFGVFREQMCTVVCPYARLQSVLLDKRSLVVGYDPVRGEPRAKGKPKPGRGDCIDCNACVTACPSGIDIRDGLQLECIACAQCADACDAIMDRVGKPHGLIRYTSQESLETRERTKFWRPRVLIYSAILAGFVAALFFAGARIERAEVTVLRGIGAPFALQGESVQNQIRVKVENRTGSAHAYRIELMDAPDLTLIAPENPLKVEAGTHQTTTLFVLAKQGAFHDGVRNVRFRVSDSEGFSRELAYKLLGPEAHESHEDRGGGS